MIFFKIFKKKSDLSKKEEEIRTYILEEYARTLHFLDEHPVSYANGIEGYTDTDIVNRANELGREAEARKILGRILDILGG